MAVAFGLTLYAATPSHAGAKDFVKKIAPRSIFGTFMKKEMQKRGYRCPPMLPWWTCGRSAQ